MSDSFMIAARVPMTRQGFEQWLDAPIDPGAISNPGEMFRGWYWDGKEVTDEWRQVAKETTPRRYFASRVAQDAAPGQVTVIVHRDGALEVYLLHFGYQRWDVHTALTLLAGTAAYTDSPQSLVMFWAETGGNLFKPDDDGWLAVLSVGDHGARFVTEADLTATVAGLRPAEQLFFDLIERLSEEEEAWDEESGAPFPTTATRDEAFVDPAFR
ncbi:hypothetical protein F4553_001173 [Allocatelliglobosispora scoriae]|uniref:Uncharacterized protein n=1 Tax=Allocatelliglobosispora scoriae TaxID=643052 RepID=A0A841BHN3_9ACTN|nr:hypothetical protein [Allocatelliglobosispora scoriae]MBB5867794.1 hypothetical protein [Allocatelliglobosispora scoriae]